MINVEHPLSERYLAREEIPQRPNMSADYIAHWLQGPDELTSLLFEPLEFHDHVYLESGPYRVRSIRDIDDMNASLQLRFIVYSGLNWMRPYNQDVSFDSFLYWEVPTPYDQHGTGLLLEHDGEPIGTICILPGTERMPVEETYEPRTLDSALPQEQFTRMELSRFCILDEHRRGVAMSLLVGGMYFYAQEQAQKHGKEAAYFVEATSKTAEEYVPLGIERLVGREEELGLQQEDVMRLHKGVNEYSELMRWRLSNTNPLLVKRWERIRNRMPQHHEVRSA